MNKLEKDYFEWLYGKIIDDELDEVYTKLISHLYDYKFTVVISMDENRGEDGKTLRHRFLVDHRLSSHLNMMDKDCSILEMMIALAIRCEESIMTDEAYGDRTGVWFWNMIQSLGLEDMTDSNFDIQYVDDVLNRFCYRKYKRNGEGGLFTIDGLRQDMRNVEIWYQMCWFLKNL